MARAKSELRPCGIASVHEAASGHPNPWEFAPDLPKQHDVTHRSGLFVTQVPSSALLERFRIFNLLPALSLVEIGTNKRARND